MKKIDSLFLIAGSHYTGLADAEVKDGFGIKLFSAFTQNKKEFLSMLKKTLEEKEDVNSVIIMDDEKAGMIHAVLKNHKTRKSFKTVFVVRIFTDENPSFKGLSGISAKTTTASFAMPSKELLDSDNIINITNLALSACRAANDKKTEYLKQFRLENIC